MDRPTLRTEAQEIGWRIFSKGGTQPEMAKAAGVGTGTVAKWVRAWRDEMGESYGRTEAAIARAEQAEAANQASARMWAELREQEARNLGVTASQVRARLLQILPSVGTARVERGEDGAAVVVYGPKATEIKALAEAVAKLIEAAELLEDRPTRYTRTGRIQLDGAGLPVEPDVDEGLLDDLLGGSDGTPADVLDAVAVLARGFLAEGVIDVDEAPPK